MATRAPASVLLVEDHVGIAEAFALVLEGDFDVHPVAPDLRSGLAAARAVGPDVVVIDYMLPDGKGTELADPVREVHPGTSFVLLTGYPHAAAVADAVEAGFAAVVWKSSPVSEWRSAIRRAAHGDATYPMETLQRLVRPTGAPQEARATSCLSAREQEVLGLLASGATTREITEALVISQHTTRNHIRHIMQKLGAHSRLEAVAIARRTGRLAPL